MPHPGPAHQQDALQHPAPDPWCRRRCDACGLSPSYRHHSREAPFFRRLDALAIYDRCARTRLSSIGYAHPVAQGFMDSLPGSVLSPSAEVVKRRAPRGQVVRQHPPRASTPKYVHDGVHHLPPRVLDRTASGFRWGQQRFQQLPLCVTEITGIGLSVHGNGLQYPPPLCIGIMCPFLDTLLARGSAPVYQFDSDWTPGLFSLLNA